MTQKEIVKLIKVDQNTITNWKKNKPELYEIVILGVSNREKTFENIPKSRKRIEMLMSQLFGFSTQSYFNWKREAQTKRKIISLLEKYFTKEDLEEFLESGKWEKFEAISGLNSEEVKDLVSFRKRVIKAVQNK